MALFSVLFDIAAKTASFDQSMKHVHSQLKELDGVARAASKGISAIGKGVGLLAGVTIGSNISRDLKQITQSILAAGAAANGPFADALDGVKSSFHDLLTPHTGIDGATKSLNELHDVLSSPAMQAAADQFTSALVGGLTNAATLGAKTLIVLEGIKESFSSTPSLADAKDNAQLSAALDAQLTKLGNARARLAMSMSMLRGAPLADAQKELDAIDAQLASMKGRQKQASGDAALDAIASQVHPDLTPQNLFPEQLGPTPAQAFADSVKEASQEISNIAAGTSKWLEDYRQQLDQADQDTQTSVEKQLADYQKKQEELELLQARGRIDAAEEARRQADLLDQTLQPVATSAKLVLKDASKDVSQFAKEAAKNAQDSLAQFFFDPFKDGLKGMVSSFLTAMEKIAANAAAADIFKAVGGSGVGKAITSIFGDLFGGGKAAGGPLDPGKWYVAGEHGPEPIWGGGAGAFAAGYGGGMGGAVTINMPVDARGATVDAVKLLPGAMKQASDNAIARVLDLKRRGKI